MLDARLGRVGDVSDGGRDRHDGRVSRPVFLTKLRVEDGGARVDPSPFAAKQREGFGACMVVGFARPREKWSVGGLVIDGSYVSLLPGVVELPVLTVSSP